MKQLRLNLVFSTTKRVSNRGLLICLPMKRDSTQLNLFHLSIGLTLKLSLRIKLVLLNLCLADSKLTASIKLVLLSIVSCQPASCMSLILELTVTSLATSLTVQLKFGTFLIVLFGLAKQKELRQLPSLSLHLNHYPLTDLALCLPFFTLQLHSTSSFLAFASLQFPKSVNFAAI